MCLPNLEFSIKAKSLFSAAYMGISKPAIEERFKELEALLGKDIVLEGDIEGAALDNFHLVGESPDKAAAFYARRVIQLYLQWLPDEIARDYANELLNTHRKFQKQNSAVIAKLINARMVERKAKTHLNKNTGLDMKAEIRDSTDMPSAMKQLLAKLNAATEAPGKKTELARFLKVPKQRVTEWLAGKPQPNGETTLQLLQWVEQQDRKK